VMSGKVRARADGPGIEFNVKKQIWRSASGSSLHMCWVALSHRHRPRLPTHITRHRRRRLAGWHGTAML